MESTFIYRWEDDITGAFSKDSLCGYLTNKNLVKLKNGKKFKVAWPEKTEDGQTHSYSARKETLQVMG